MPVVSVGFKKFKWPWEDWGGYVQKGLEAPSVVPVGGLASTITKTFTKSVVKTGAQRGLIVGGAVIGAALLLSQSGQKQEQRQTAAQDLASTQKQNLAQAARQRLRDLRQSLNLKMKAAQDVDVTTAVSAPSDVKTSYDIKAGGDVDIGGVSHISNVTTITEASPRLAQVPTQAPVGQQTVQTETPIQVTYQVPSIGQYQEASQVSSTNWLLIAALGLGAYFLLGDKKK